MRQRTLTNVVGPGLRVRCASDGVCLACGAGLGVGGAA
jgi:hypothetical protein